MTRPREVRTRRSLAALMTTCLVVLGAAPVHAAGAAAVDARYRVQSMGLDLGRALLRLDSAAHGLSTHFRLQNDALLGFVEASDTQMTSLVAPEHGKLSPVSFEGVYSKDDRVREIDVGYDGKGAIASYQLAKRGQVRLTAVPAGLAAGTVDPLAAMLLVRAWLEQAPEGAELALKVFDGRKRYDTTVRYLGLTQLADSGASTPAHKVSLTYMLVAALDEDTGRFETEAAAKLRELDLAVSADGRYVPLRIDGSLDGLPISAVLAGDCAGPAGCAAAE